MGKFRHELFDLLARAVIDDDPSGRFPQDPEAPAKLKNFKNDLAALVLLRARDVIKRTGYKTAAPVSIEILFSDSIFTGHPAPPVLIQRAPYVSSCWTDVDNEDTVKVVTRLSTKRSLPCD